MKLVIVPPALAELQDAADHYALHGGLGHEFITEFERIINLILANPRLGTPMRGARRYFMSRFPYGVIYQVTADELRIIAIAHQRRRPAYWRGRK
jgi:plasmid stabilization system protein ParE